MKKILFTGLVLLSLLAMSTGAALAAGASVSLVEVRNDSGGGVIFVFKVSGEFSKSELNNGYVQVQGGDNYGLYCNQVDESTVQCSTSKKTGDQNVAVNFGGSTFWTFVPEASSPVFCYSAWSFLDYDAETDTYAELDGWKDFGPYCQEQPAVLFDMINIPPLGRLPLYFYDVDVSSECGGTVPYNGPAYYFPSCPN